SLAELLRYLLFFGRMGHAHSRWALRSGPDREVSSGKDGRRGSPPSCRRVGGGLGAEHYPNLATGERCYFTTESLTSFRLSWRAPLRGRPTSAPRAPESDDEE